jgi:hypothetical protein
MVSAIRVFGIHAFHAEILAGHLIRIIIAKIKLSAIIIPYGAAKIKKIKIPDRK